MAPLTRSQTPGDFIKLLRTGRRHNNHTYTEGLNVCPQPWDDGDCTPGGFYVCSLTDIFLWIVLYPDITEVAWVKVPADAQMVRFVSKVKASKLVITRFIPVADALSLARHAGADIHAGGDFALCLASSRGYTEIVRLLLEAGADIHASNDYPLRIATMDNHIECVRLLLKAGAGVDIAFRIATTCGHNACARLIQSYM